MQLAASNPASPNVPAAGTEWTLADVQAKAVDVLGSPANAASWLRHPAMALDGDIPADLLVTPEGRAEVGTLLLQLEYGVYV